MAIFMIFLTCVRVVIFVFRKGNVVAALLEINWVSFIFTLLLLANGVV